MGEAGRDPPHHKMDTTSELQISSAELKKHSTRQDCWVAVHSKVWDLTDFLDEHPGGAKSKSTPPSESFFSSQFIQEMMLFRILEDSSDTSYRAMTDM